MIPSDRQQLCFAIVGSMDMFPQLHHVETGTENKERVLELALNGNVITKPSDICQRDKFDFKGVYMTVEIKKDIDGTILNIGGDGECVIIQIFHNQEIVIDNLFR